MKITFIKSNKELNIKLIRIFLKDIVGNEIGLDLKLGEYVYSETNHITNSLRIYSRKGLIKIEDKAKPDELEYYVNYDKSLKQIVSEITEEVSNSEVKNKTVENDASIEKTKLDKIKDDVKEYESKDEKDKSKKIGPGRPKKGEKRPKKKKGKRGRPKKRGPKKGYKRRKKA